MKHPPIPPNCFEGGDLKKIETLTADQEQNAEVRRIMIERVGTGKYLEMCNAMPVDIDTHNHNGTRALMSTDTGRYLVCACPSTGRVYHMEVPPEVITCQQADEYLCGPVMSGGRIIGAT